MDLEVTIKTNGMLFYCEKEDEILLSLGCVNNSLTGREYIFLREDGYLKFFPLLDNLDHVGDL